METQSILDAFQKKVQENPAATAVFDSQQRLTGAELSRLADTIAAKLPERCHLPDEHLHP